MSAARIRRFLHGMAGRRVDLAPPGERPRATLGDARLALPAALTESEQFAAAAHALAHWRHSPCDASADALTPIGLAVAGLVEDARAETLLLAAWPGLRAGWAPSYAPIDRTGLTFNLLCARLAKALFEPAYRDGNPWVDRGAALFRDRLGALGDYRALRQVASVLANDLGQMRVRFEPDDGTWLRYRDDNAWLWTRTVDATEPAAPPWLDALTGDAARDGGDAYDPPTPDTAAPRYPEWHVRTRRERRRWTTVLERPTPAATPDAALAAAIAADRLAAPAAPAARAHALARRAGAQLDGDTLDLDATIALRVARRARTAPDPRIFRRRVPREQPAPVLILLDLSASTAMQVAALEKRAACLFGDLLEGQRRRWAIHGYTSNGRHRVYYTRFKDFDEPFDAPRRDALLGAGSGLGTRTGAALRHAAALLRRAAPRERANLVLIGDGEAADIDVFDPRHLAEDARHAAARARHGGIVLLGLSFGAPPGLSTILDTGAHCRHAADDAPLPALVARLAARLSG
ncbi:nitric oxide reductase activation protein [Burkholderia alba]|uniref:nitric oxide reductase activation protein n=1 Tax=Burkholderia alba TaxID=2683677 RepID=UPI002B05B434|nr:nitric oxide reductase activation protein [Burkholderia alba]